MKKIVFGVLTTILFLSISCDKNKSCKTALDAPLITSNSPITAGDTAILSVPKIQNVVYNWLGPFQFRSDSNSIAIITYDTHCSGQFLVQYLTQDCVSDPAIADLVVNPPSIPCSHAMNHGEVIGYRPSIAFTDVNFISSDDNLTYVLSANAGWNDDYIRLQFVANMKPQNGIYMTTSGFYPDFGEVHFSFSFNDDYWVVTDGKVYVSTVNGKLTAVWCNLPCNRSWDGLECTTSGSLTQP